MTASEAIEAKPASRAIRPLMYIGTLIAIMALLFGLPWWTMIGAADWPAPVTAVGTSLFVLGFVTFPVLMAIGHGRRHLDWAARIADTTLGVAWVFFVQALLGNVVRLGLAVGGVEDPTRSRVVALAVAAVGLVLVVWGNYEAMRVPRVREVDVVIPRLGKGLDGLKVALITDTHYGPIDRARWAQGVADKVNELEADIVCHTGDIADGTAEQRKGEASTLGGVKAKYARVYVTGNHEYYSEADGWLQFMQGMGWEPMRNKHFLLERGGDTLVVAGIDDATAAGSGRPGHGADLDAALSGADPELPVLLLAHQPKQIFQSMSKVDLQLSGHTHGGQIWPFNFMVRMDQPVVAGLSRHGDRTQLYTSRGTGFWGPPLRVFAPSEITLIRLRSA